MQSRYLIWMLQLQKISSPNVSTTLDDSKSFLHKDAIFATKMSYITWHIGESTVGLQKHRQMVIKDITLQNVSLGFYFLYVLMQRII